MDKLLDKIEEGMWKHRSDPNSVSVTVTFQLPLILNAFVDTVVAKLGGTKQNLLNLLVESIVAEQLRHRTEEVCSVPRPAIGDVELKQGLQVENLGATLSEFAKKMKILQELTKNFQHLTEQVDDDNNTTS